MPAKYTREGWKKLVDRGLASGKPPNGFLEGKRSAKHADCASVVNEEICDRLEAKTQQPLGAVSRALPNHRPGDKQILIVGEIQVSERGDSKVQTERAGLRILVDRVLNVRPSVVAPMPVPTHIPTPEPTPAPVVERSAQYLHAEGNADTIYSDAFHAARRAVEPIAVGLANLAAGRPQNVRVVDRVALVSRSIRASGGIRPDGKVSPGVAARRMFGLTYPGSSQAYINRSGQRVEGVHDPRAKGPSISVMARRSLGLQGDGRQPDSRSKFPSRHMPEITFRSKAARDQYDQQLSGNVHDGSVIVRTAQVNVGE